MKMTRSTVRHGIATLTVAVLSLGGASAVIAEQAAMTSAASMSVDINYLLYTPEDYESSEQDYPLVVWLHGGDQGGNDVSLVRESGLPSMIEQGKNLPFVVFSPQNPSEELLYPIERIKAALDEVVATHRIDESRIYLIGYSRGAFGAWAMASQFPDTFAAVVPIAGGGTRHYLNRTSENTAFWAFHSTDDDVIPLSDTVVLVQRLKELDRNVRLSILEGVTHEGVEMKALEDPELWDWLGQQQLTPTEVAE
ncbi:PHB depolymerase family esterase [Paracoccus onubensis]|uniref:carboxylesterase family protein n=1 Tax=Paracoccus onubensis TaxID=1675788 RepID=UPI00272FB066|nr:PHB depolymerase family esterase [Paracoccus onubensis]MDP0929879.1 PHB depolymerase family esterase [Paracoccus onubensis]